MFCIKKRSYYNCPFVLTGTFSSLTIVLSETQDNRNNANIIERKNVDNFVLAISVYLNIKRSRYWFVTSNVLQ